MHLRISISADDYAQICRGCMVSVIERLDTVTMVVANPDGIQLDPPRAVNVQIFAIEAKYGDPLMQYRPDMPNDRLPRLLMTVGLAKPVVTFAAKRARRGVKR